MVAAAVRRFVELGARIMVGRAEAAPDLYTIPVPVRGFLSPGGIARESCGTLGRGVREGVDCVIEYELVGFSVLDDERLLLLATGLVEGARRLLFDDFGWRLDDWGRRSGRGTGDLAGSTDGAIGLTCPTEPAAEPFEADDSVRSLGNGIELSDPTRLKFLPDIVFGVAVFSRPCTNEPMSSSPTGVNGIGRLAVDALEGVVVPVPSSNSFSRM